MLNTRHIRLGMSMPARCSAIILVACLLVVLPAALAQTVLSSSTLSKCVNDGTVRYLSLKTDNSILRHGTCLTTSVNLQTSTTTLSCSNKLVVNLVIAAGTNLVTESLDFTIPCIGRYPARHAMTAQDNLPHSTTLSLACRQNHVCC